MNSISQTPFDLVPVAGFFVIAIILYYKFYVNPRKQASFVKVDCYIELFTGEIFYVLEVTESGGEKFLKVKDYENNLKIITTRNVFRVVDIDLFK